MTTRVPAMKSQSETVEESTARLEQAHASGTGSLMSDLKAALRVRTAAAAAEEDKDGSD